MREYNLTFYAALEKVMNGEWVKGEDFKNGFYLRLDCYDIVAMVDVDKFGSESNLFIHAGLIRQKYRIITVATMKELST